MEVEGGAEVVGKVCGEGAGWEGRGAAQMRNGGRAGGVCGVCVCVQRRARMGRKGSRVAQGRAVGHGWTATAVLTYY